MKLVADVAHTLRGDLNNTAFGRDEGCDPRHVDAVAAKTEQSLRKSALVHTESRCQYVLHVVTDHGAEC